MERRRTRRKKVNIEAKLISGENSYSGLIENISEHGLYLETDSKDLLNHSTRFGPGAEYEVKFRTDSGEEIKLSCKVTWSYKIAPFGLTKKVGMEVIFPPPDYIDLCNKASNTGEEQEL